MENEADLKARSYLVAVGFPFGDSFRLVMEDSPGSCDIYEGARVSLSGVSKSLTICQLFSAGVLMQPEVHTRQVISSFLADCRMRHEPCHAVDIGANNGWVSGMMLTLGVMNLTSVEPQPDLAGALRDTVRLNCWQDHAIVHSNAITLEISLDAKPVMMRGGYRLYHYTASGQRLDHYTYNTTWIYVGRVFSLSRYDLIKIDVDGIDGDLLEWLHRRVQERVISVETIVIECSGCSAHILWSFQQELGYHAYILDNTDERRFLNSKGRDIVNEFRPIPDLDPALEERYALRFLRHVFYVKPSADPGAWERILAPRVSTRRHIPRSSMGPREIVLTKQQLLQPEHNDVISDKFIRNGRNYHLPQGWIRPNEASSRPQYTG